MLPNSKRWRQWQNDWGYKAKLIECKLILNIGRHSMQHLTNGILSYKFFYFSTFMYRFRHISPEQGIVCRNEGIGPQRQFIGTDKKENIVQQQFIYSRCKPKMTNSMFNVLKKDKQFILRGMIYLPKYDDSLRIQLEGPDV